MAWIESHQRLEKSWKLHRLADQLGINVYQAIGHLHAFWWWCLDNAGRDGDLSRYTPNEIAIAAGWDRYVHERVMDHDRGPKEYPEAYAFCHALVSVTLLDMPRGLSQDPDKPLGEGARIHDWQEYSSRYFDTVESFKNRREQERIRQRRRRDSVRILSRTSERDSTRPNLTIPNHTNSISEPRVFTPPTPDEVTAYAKEIGFYLDGQKFVDHYAASGWMRGKSKIKDWKACVRTWRKSASNNERKFVVDFQ